MSHDQKGYEGKPQNDMRVKEGCLCDRESKGLSEVTRELRRKDEKLLPMQRTGKCTSGEREPVQRGVQSWEVHRWERQAFPGRLLSGTGRPGADLLSLPGRSWDQPLQPLLSGEGLCQDHEAGCYWCALTGHLLTF